MTGRLLVLRATNQCMPCHFADDSVDTQGSGLLEFNNDVVCTWAKITIDSEKWLRLKVEIQQELEFFDVIALVGLPQCGNGGHANSAL